MLNVDNEREAELTDAGVQEVNVNLRVLMEVNVDDMRNAVKKLKNGKSSGIDGITSEMLRYGGESVIEWLTRVCGTLGRGESTGGVEESNSFTHI